MSIDAEAGNWEINLIAAHAVAGIEGFVADRVPAWHWAHALTQEVGPEDFTLVPGAVLGEDNLEVFCDTCSLRVVESLHIQRIDADGQPLGAPVPTTCHYDASEGVLYATAEAHGPTPVGQVSDFESEERYDEGEAEAARNRFYVTRRVLLNNDPADLLHSFLDSGLPYSVPAALRDKSYSVTIDDKGKASVSLVTGWRDQTRRLLRAVRKAIARPSAR